jgi:hypothetical protein
MGVVSKVLAGKDPMAKMLARAMYLSRAGSVATLPFGTVEKAADWAALVTDGKVGRANAKGWRTRHDAEGYAGVLVWAVEDRDGTAHAFGEVPASWLPKAAAIAMGSPLALPAAGSTVVGAAESAADTVSADMAAAGSSKARKPRARRAAAKSA